MALAVSVAGLTGIAETLKIATFNVELSRRGPGLLLRDILAGTDAQVRAVVQVIAAVSPDILLLTGFDYDLGAVALRTLETELAKNGTPYPHLFALQPNTGMATGLDLDGDGRLGGPGDAQGYGDFSGEGGMALLSRLPVDAEAAEDYSGFLWKDLPGGLIGGADLSAEAGAVQRLSSTGHWAVPVLMPDGTRLRLLAYHASPPVFDGPEDRNGRRNHDETAFWLRLLAGELPWAAPKTPFVIIGDANLDPADGEGRTGALLALLSNAKVQDASPRSVGGANAGRLDEPNMAQRGDPALDTANLSGGTGPGNMRVDYVLPSADLRVIAAGVWWPDGGEPAETVATASRHRLVWVEIDRP